MGWGGGKKEDSGNLRSRPSRAKLGVFNSGLGEILVWKNLENLESLEWRDWLHVNVFTAGTVSFPHLVSRLVQKTAVQRVSCDSTPLFFLFF